MHKLSACLLLILAVSYSGQSFRDIPDIDDFNVEKRFVLPIVKFGNLAKALKLKQFGNKRVGNMFNKKSYSNLEDDW